MFLDVNFIAVAVAALINFLIGMAWYSHRAFGKCLHHHDCCKESSCAETSCKQSSCKDSSCCKSSWKCCLGGFLISFITAWVFAVLIDYLGLDSVGEGVHFAFLVWLGFIATSYFSCVLWHKQRLCVYFINIGYQLVSLAFLGALLTAWQA